MTGGNFLRRIMTPFAVELLDFSEEKRHRGYLFTINISYNVAITLTETA